MPNHIVLLSDAESRRLTTTGTLLVVRPVVPQPPEGTHSLVWNANEGEDLPHLWLADNDHGEYPGSVDFDPYVRCPLGAPGDVLVCKEAWRYDDDPENYNGMPLEDPRRVLYSDCPLWDEVEQLIPFPHLSSLTQLRPASTMPPWAVRHRPVVVEAGVMRVGDIPGKDAEAMGLDVVAKMPAFPPRGTDVDALIDAVGKQVIARDWNRRYRAYPYESNCWAWFARVEQEHHG